MKNKPVIVLGLGPAGLFLTRQLSVLTKNIFLIGRTDDVGLFTRYCKRKNRFCAVTTDELEEVFRKILQRVTTKPILYICSDQYLSILLEHKERWNNYVELSDSDYETLSLINDKNTINEYCHEHNVRIPETYSYDSFCKDKEFPKIIKWVEKRIETAVNPIGKVRICRNESELDTINKLLEKSGIQNDELFVQTFIEGKNDCQYSVGGYYKNGSNLADVVVNQVKQYPQGVSAEVVTVFDPVCDRLRRITRSFAEQLSYSGFLEIEYKIDSVTNDIYLLDVNPRPWGWISILGKVYPDFYRVLIGEAPSESNRTVVWKSPLRKVLGKRNKQNCKLPAGIKKYEVAYDILDLHDIGPSFGFFLVAMKKIVRRIRR